MKREPTAEYYIDLVKKSRRFGSAYLHAGMPSEFDANGVKFTVRGYGRSLQSRGHKYKAYAHRDGKIVRTKNL